ncbi:leucine-rich repeat domain-containing protein [Bacteroidales bacterium OttesenSCG-928-M06]|nr:leucine-rich repeat domain-containing protein [Bacteroidales bacterium OttesenSCG-928-M06]
MKRKLLTVLMCGMFAISTFAQSGTTGSLIWTFSETTGELTIEGKGAMPDYDSDTQPWSDYQSSIKSVAIGDGVVRIGNRAFSDCALLVSITMPNSVTTIGDYAFSYCSALVSIHLSNSLTIIGEWTFVGCNSLISIILPNSLITIGDGAFSYCASLASIVIPNSVTTIGDHAFSSCTSFNSITIPNSITTVGKWAFVNCISLTSILVDANNSHYTSESGVLFDKKKEVLIQYPEGKKEKEYTVPNSVIKIGNSAFSNCVSLASITIPNSVISIEMDAFLSCSFLKEVQVSWLTPLDIITGVLEDVDPNTSTAIPISIFFGVDLSVCTLYVPKDTKVLYEVADGWRDFGTIIEGEMITDIDTPELESTIYIAGNTLYVDTPVAEPISVYSIKGELLYEFNKPEGEATFSLNNDKEQIVIVKRGSGETKKIIRGFGL